LRTLLGDDVEIAGVEVLRLLVERPCLPGDASGAIDSRGG